MKMYMLVLGALCGMLMIVVPPAEAANTMATQTYSFTVIADTTPPYISGQAPAAAATNVAQNSTIVMHVKDDGAGVDKASIVMKVNTVAVTPVITGTAADYTLTYTPTTNFGMGQVISVSVTAKDLAP